MSALKITLFCLATLSFAPDSWSQETNVSEKDQLEIAVKKSSEDLANPGSRDKLIHHDENAKKTHDKLLEFTGGDKEKTEDIYKAASQILRKKKFSSTEEMMKWIEEAQKNPENFMKNLSAEDKAAISDIAKKMEKKSKP